MKTRILGAVTALVVLGVAFVALAKHELFEVGAATAEASEKDGARPLGRDGAGSLPTGKVESAALSGRARSLYPAKAARLLIEGVLVDEKRQPVSGVQIRLFRAPGLATALATSRSAVLAASTTGKDGLFRLNAPASQPWQKFDIRASYPGYCALRVAGLHVPRPETSILRLGFVVMKVGCQLTGKVIGKRGRPLANVSVRATSSDLADKAHEGDAPGVGLATVTDKSGRFSIRHLREGAPYDLVVTPRDKAYAVSRQFSLSLPRRRPLLIYAVEGQNIQGTVRDGGGRGIAKSIVRAYVLDELAGGTPQKRVQLPVHQVRSRDDGAYVLDRLPPGRYRVEVVANGFGKVSRSARSGATQVDLTFRGSIVSGVTVRGEQPVANIIVRVTSDATNERSFSARTLSGANGRFAFPVVVPPGPYTVGWCERVPNPFVVNQALAEDRKRFTILRGQSQHSLRLELGTSTAR